MTGNKGQLSNCLVMDVLKILREEEERRELEEIDAAIIRTCISLILKEVEASSLSEFIIEVPS